MYKIRALVLLLITTPYALESASDCSKLRVGQFLCPDPDSSYNYIDEKTQSIIGCTKEGKAIGEISKCLFYKIYNIYLFAARCLASEGITCSSTGNNTFHHSVPCDFT